MKPFSPPMHCITRDFDGDRSANIKDWSIDFFLTDLISGKSQDVEQTSHLLIDAAVKV